MTKEEYIDGIINAKDRYKYYVDFDNIRAVKDFKIAELRDIGEQYLSDEEKSRVILTRPFALKILMWIDITIKVFIIVLNWKK